PLFLLSFLLPSLYLAWSFTNIRWERVGVQVIAPWTGCIMSMLHTCKGAISRRGAIRSTLGPVYYFRTRSLLLISLCSLLLFLMGCGPSSNGSSGASPIAIQQ